MAKPTLEDRIEAFQLNEASWCYECDHHRTGDRHPSHHEFLENPALAIIDELQGLLTARVKEYVWLHNKSDEQAARIAELKKQARCAHRVRMTKAHKCADCGARVDPMTSEPMNDERLERIEREGHGLFEQELLSEIRRLREENARLKKAGERLRAAVKDRGGVRGEILNALTDWYIATGDRRGGQHVNKGKP